MCVVSVDCQSGECVWCLLVVGAVSVCVVSVDCLSSECVWCVWCLLVVTLLCGSRRLAVTVVL